MTEKKKDMEEEEEEEREMPFCFGLPSALQAEMEYAYYILRRIHKERKQKETHEQLKRRLDCWLLVR